MFSFQGRSHTKTRNRASIGLVAAEVRIRAYDAETRKRLREDDESFSDEEAATPEPTAATAEPTAATAEPTAATAEPTAATAEPTAEPTATIEVETQELLETEQDEAAKAATAAAIQRIRAGLITQERAQLFLELVQKLAVELTIREGAREKHISVPQYRKYVRAGEGFRFTSLNQHHVYRIADPNVWFEKVAVSKSQSKPWLSIDEYLTNEVQDVLGEEGEAKE
jgi:hypothetical protein